MTQIRRRGLPPLDAFTVIALRFYMSLYFIRAYAFPLKVPLNPSDKRGKTREKIPSYLLPLSGELGDLGG